MSRQPAKLATLSPVRAAALNILATLEPLRDKPDVPLQEWRRDVPKATRAALWLVDSSANSLLEQLNTEKPDWDQIGVAAIFAEWRGAAPTWQKLTNVPSWIATFPSPVVPLGVTPS